MTSAEDLFARIQAHLVTAQLSSAQLADVAAQLALLIGAASSEHGEVHATVNHRGIMRSLVFRDGARDLPVTELGPVVMATVQAAIADLQLQAKPIQSQLALTDAPTLGTTDEIIQQLDDILFAKSRSGTAETERDR